MRDLLTRLIGENVELEFRLDPDLGLVKIDEAQAQQIILNLVLNARDVLTNGGRIVVETSNCRFQTVAGSTLPRYAQTGVLFPCILLIVADNGHGMDAKTRRGLFEPFFTTKKVGQATGLGLTTVHSIVTTNHGLIHIESEPGQGTRAMILLPLASQSTDAEFRPISHPHPVASPKPLNEAKKESLL
ncbi:MAG: ATP-binding protein [Candidatus Sulfotelmatobacter sp.]